jgi:hypothetical protein
MLGRVGASACRLGSSFESSDPEQPTAKKITRHARTTKGAPVVRNPLTLLSAKTRIIPVLRASQAFQNSRLTQGYELCTKITNGCLNY